MPQPLHTRFAPTPSGYLHIGNAYSFVLTWLHARKSGGTIRLRIDDIDAERVRHEYVEDIFKSLDWLGLDYDSGPRVVDDFFTHYSQSLRAERYNHFINHLIEKQAVFACNCSRKQILESSPDGQYNGHCLPLHLPFDMPESALRIVTPPNQSTAVFNDVWNDYGAVDVYEHMRYFVVRTKSGHAAYQLASVVDDMDYNINFIVRGADLLHSTAAQIFLANQLTELSGFTQIQFLHHPLLTDETGQKLSKSAGSVSLFDRRKNGEDATLFYRKLSAQMQLPECASAQEMLQVWDIVG